MQAAVLRTLFVAPVYVAQLSLCHCSVVAVSFTGCEGIHPQVAGAFFVVVWEWTAHLTSSSSAIEAAVTQDLLLAFLHVVIAV